MAATRAAVSVEFIVKPREDLYLEGKLRRLPRVLKGLNSLLCDRKFRHP